jgi:HEPN domain-containing protein
MSAKARDDAAAMRRMAEDAEIADSIVGFHAQQAIEKWIKALLASNQVGFNPRHDLDYHLVDLLEPAVDQFPFERVQLTALTEYAVQQRYDEAPSGQPLDRNATVGLVDRFGAWAEGQL